MSSPAQEGGDHGRGFGKRGNLAWHLTVWIYSICHVDVDRASCNAVTPETLPVALQPPLLVALQALLVALPVMLQALRSALRVMMRVRVRALFDGLSRLHGVHVQRLDVSAALLKPLGRGDRSVACWSSALCEDSAATESLSITTGARLRPRSRAGVSRNSSAQHHSGGQRRIPKTPVL